MPRGYVRKEAPTGVHQHRRNIGRHQAKMEHEQQKEFEELLLQSRRPDPPPVAADHWALDIPDERQPDTGDATRFDAVTSPHIVSRQESKMSVPGVLTLALFLSTVTAAGSGLYALRNSWNTPADPESSEAPGGSARPATEGTTAPAAFESAPFESASFGTAATSTSRVSPPGPPAKPLLGQWKLEELERAKLLELKQICDRDPLACEDVFETDLDPLLGNPSHRITKRGLPALFKRSWNYPADPPQTAEQRWPSLSGSETDVIDVKSHGDHRYRVVKVRSGIGVAVGDPKDVEAAIKEGRPLKESYGFLDDVLKSLHILESTHQGKKLLKTITHLEPLHAIPTNSWTLIDTPGQLAPVRIVIVQGAPGATPHTQPLWSADASNGYGTGSVIKWRPHFVETFNPDGSRVVINPFQGLAHEMIHATHAVGGVQLDGITEFTFRQEFSDGVEDLTLKLVSDEISTHGNPKEIDALTHRDKMPYRMSDEVIAEEYDVAGADKEQRARIKKQENLRKDLRGITEYELSKEARIGARELYLSFPEAFNALTKSQGVQAVGSSNYVRLYDAGGKSQTLLPVALQKENHPDLRKKLAATYPEISLDGDGPSGAKCAFGCAQGAARLATQEQVEKAAPLPEEVEKDRKNVRALVEEVIDLEQRRAGIDAAERAALDALMGAPEISRMANSPADADAVRAVATKMKAMGYSDIEYRAVAIRGGSEIGSNDGAEPRIHYAIKARKGGFSHIVDIFAGELARENVQGFSSVQGSSGHVFETEDAWLHQYQKSATKKEMRFADSASLSEAKELVSGGGPNTSVGKSGPVFVEGPKPNPANNVESRMAPSDSLHPGAGEHLEKRVKAKPRTLIASKLAGGMTIIDGVLRVDTVTGSYIMKALDGTVGYVYNAAQTWARDSLFFPSYGRAKVVLQFLNGLDTEKLQKALDRAHARYGRPDLKQAQSDIKIAVETDWNPVGAYANSITPSFSAGQVERVMRAIDYYRTSHVIETHVLPSIKAYVLSFATMEMPSEDDVKAIQGRVDKSFSGLAAELSYAKTYGISQEYRGQGLTAVQKHLCGNVFNRNSQADRDRRLMLCGPRYEEGRLKGIEAIVEVLRTEFSQEDWLPQVENGLRGVAKKISHTGASLGPQFVEMLRKSLIDDLEKYASFERIKGVRALLENLDAKEVQGALDRAHATYGNPDLKHAVRDIGIVAKIDGNLGEAFAAGRMPTFSAGQFDRVEQAVKYYRMLTLEEEMIRSAKTYLRFFVSRGAASESDVKTMQDRVDKAFSGWAAQFAYTKVYGMSQEYWGQGLTAVQKHLCGNVFNRNSQADRDRRLVLCGPRYEEGRLHGVEGIMTIIGNNFPQENWLPWIKSMLEARWRA